jgi:2-polyprenyl-3-methyl-5-hydroxy-6-metoxy-1,4-benzoquinol methylase
MLAIAKERAVSLGLQDIIEFRESDIEALELASSSFDAILCRWGLMFLPNLDSTLNHIFSALMVLYLKQDSEIFTLRDKMSHLNLLQLKIILIISKM